MPIIVLAAIYRSLPFERAIHVARDLESQRCPLALSPCPFPLDLRWKFPHYDRAGALHLLRVASEWILGSKGFLESGYGACRGHETKSFGIP